MYMNWLTPLAQPRPAGEKGWGSFAATDIPAGHTVAAFGGYSLPRAALNALPAERRARSLQIDDDLYLVSAEQAEPGDLINHSCDPNCGLVGSILVVTMRTIAPGEELTFDYAMGDASDYDEFVCRCQSSNCRGTVTGSDWRQSNLQERYSGWFSSYLERRIARLPSERLPHAHGSHPIR
jgi:uncharacterized protein